MSNSNMSRPFRTDYRALTQEEKDAAWVIKSDAEVLYEHININVTDERMRALAKTKLEECVMWAVKGITG